jgi:hypothetical protein
MDSCCDSHEIFAVSEALITIYQFLSNSICGLRHFFNKSFSHLVVVAGLHSITEIKLFAPWPEAMSPNPFKLNRWLALPYIVTVQQMFRKEGPRSQSARNARCICCCTAMRRPCCTRKSHASALATSNSRLSSGCGCTAAATLTATEKDT